MSKFNTYQDYLEVKKLLYTAEIATIQAQGQQALRRAELRKELNKLDDELDPKLQALDAAKKDFLRLHKQVLSPWKINTDYGWSGTRYAGDEAWYTRRAWLRPAGLYTANGDRATSIVMTKDRVRWCWTLDYDQKSIKIVDHDLRDPDSIREVMEKSDALLLEAGWILT